MAKKIVKAILKYPLILVNRIYTYFKYKNSVKNENYLVDDMFEGNKKVLVVAPHVDDETIGVGGTLLKHKKKKDNISLIYVSDGGGSTSELSREKVIEERRKEGKELKKALEIGNLYFLDEPDGSVVSTKEELIEKIFHVLEEENPDIIYTPFLIDGHRDHVETTKGVIKAIEKWNTDFSNIYMYEVNCPIEPNLVNSISTMDEKIYLEKEKLYEVFKSQWAMGFSVFSLLNRRKKFLLGKEYGAEVFVKGNLENTKKAVKALIDAGFEPEQFKQLSSEYNLLLTFRKNSQLKDEYVEHVKNVISEEMARR